MSQHDLNVANASRSTVRADINSALAALGTLQKGSSAPSGPSAGWLWLDDDTPSSTKWTLKQYDGSDWIPVAYIDTVANTWTPVSALSIAGALGHLAGWAYQPNGSNPTTRLDIAAGRAVDTTGVALLEGGAMTKRYDAVWAAGNGNGGRSGSAADGDWWIHACLDVDDQLVDYFYSQSRTAPTLPSGYTLFVPIGWFRVASSAIVAFSTAELPGGGLEYNWTTPRQDVANATDLTTTRRLDVLSVPLGISVQAHVTAQAYDGTNTGGARICSPAETDRAPAISNAGGTIANANLVWVPGASLVPFEGLIRTDTSGRVATRSSIAAVGLFNLTTNGFHWNRR